MTGIRAFLEDAGARPPATICLGPDLFATLVFAFVMVLAILAASAPLQGNEEPREQAAQQAAARRAFGKRTSEFVKAVVIHDFPSSLAVCRDHHELNAS